MKNLLLLLVAISLFSCQEEAKPNYVLFNGTVENANANSVKIFGNGFDKELAISENGTFADTLKITNNGYYTMRVGRESSPVYLTKGATVGVTINTKEFDESLVYTGNLSKENNYLAAKYLLSEKGMELDKMYSLPEAGFLTEIDKLNDSYKLLLNATEGVSEDFIAKESKELEYAHFNNIENYQEYYRYFVKDNEFAVSGNFYDALKDVDYSDMKAYNSSKAYKSLLETHFYRIANVVKEQEGFSEALAYLQAINDNVPNGNEKDELMTNYLRYGMKADNSLEEVYTLYKTVNPTSENLARLTKRYEQLKTLTPGKTSPTFTYENHKGGETSLADLKGKVVYVDVWATWCAPCKREIPFLKELDKDYHGKKIAFVSISIDEEKNYDAWRTMVTEKELGGYQLMADKDWRSKFVEDYGIKGIPRFLLIDAEGNIINSDAPRPSSTEIREVIDGLI
ncbi:MAG: TlpA disulfide reductase family protein [Flavobacteriaceae bacterium]